MAQQRVRVGNFDHPAAMEFLTTILKELENVVEQAFKAHTDGKVGCGAEFYVMPSIEILALLCERYGAPPPKARKLQQWRKKMLKIYDEAPCDGCPTRGTDKRRKEIEKTFAWLESLSETYHSG